MLERVPLMTLELQQQAFSRTDWIFEIKHDGFRSAVYIEDDTCTLISRKDHVYKRFDDLATSLAKTLRGRTVVLDGEIVCLDEHGRAQFFELMSPARGMTYLYAFDVLHIDGEDVRRQPLIERKRRLRELVPAGPSRLLYVDYIEDDGAELFDKICALDLEGTVSKAADGFYDPKRTKWIKVKNKNYSQLKDRGKLFARPK